jgi:hypothetical protein
MRVSSRPGLRALLVGLALGSVAACGSTVAGNGQTLTPAGAPADGPGASAHGALGADGLSLPAAPGIADGRQGATGGSVRGGGGADSLGGETATGAGSERNGATTGSAGVAAERPAAPASGTGPGISATTVKVGVVYINDAAAANRALGAGVGEADAEATFDAIVADINATGGIAGRKLEPVYAPYEVNSAQPYDAVYQQACTRMTQDNKVFAAIAAIPSETFRGCLQKAQVVHVSDGISRSDATVLARYPHTYEIGSVRTDRVATHQLMALKDGGYFSPWDTSRGTAGSLKPKVGVVSSDAISIARAVDGVLVPGLRQLGYDPVVIKIAQPQSSSQSGDAVAAIQAAVLKMRQEGVTHVIPFDSNGSLTLFFTRNAEAQAYRPRYGVNTGNGMQILLDSGSIPATQAAGAVGLSTSPLQDLRPADNPDGGRYANPARSHCLEVMRKAGVTIQDTNSKAGVLQLCATAYFLRERLTDVHKAGLPLNRDNLRNVVQRSGGAFVHGDVGRTAFGPSQHDGGAIGYLQVFRSDCTCMRYVGGPRSL